MGRSNVDISRGFPHYSLPYSVAFIYQNRPQSSYSAAYYCVFLLFTENEETEKSAVEFYANLKCTNNKLWIQKYGKSHIMRKI
jgi:hypothetical protein